MKTINFYSNGNIAYGPAFVNAYMLEGNVAIYPRIIFTRSVYDSYLKINSKNTVETLYDLMTLDEYSQLFFADYIKFSLNRMNNDSMYSVYYGIEAEKICDKIKRFIEDELASQTNPDIRKKYVYFKEYYNQVIKYFEDEYNGTIYKCEPIFNDNHKKSKTTQTECHTENHCFDNNNINNSSNVAFGNGATVINK